MPPGKSPQREGSAVPGQLFRKKDTDFIRENMIINYCLGNDDSLFIESYVRNNNIALLFDVGNFYCFMTGTHKRFVERYTHRTLQDGIEGMLVIYDLLLSEMRAWGFEGNILLAKEDNSKQIVMLFSPTDRARCTPEDMAGHLYLRYISAKDPYPGAGPEFVSTSFVGPYSGYENIHQAFQEVRALNDLIFFGVRHRVITPQYRNDTARPCATTAIFMSFRRLLNTVCSGTLQSALRQADDIIDGLVAPSYSLDNFHVVFACCQDMFSMFAAVYPEQVHLTTCAYSTFYTLEDYRQYLRDQIGAIFDQLEGQARYSPTMLMALSFINQNYTSDISLTQVAEYVYSNASTLSSEFNAAMGGSFSEYVAKLRVRRAQHLLRHTPSTIQQIARQCGFSDVKYFRQVFKKVAGVTPQAYRSGA